MEGIAKIKERILEEAREEKQKLVDDAKTQARDIKAKYEHKAKEMLNDILDKAGKAAEEKKRRILSMAQLENRKALLQAKQQIIDEVFEKAKAKLAKMPDEEYLSLITDMLQKSVITGNEEVVISEHDKIDFTGLLAKVNET